MFSNKSRPIKLPAALEERPDPTIADLAVGERGVLDLFHIIVDSGRGIWVKEDAPLVCVAPRGTIGATRRIIAERRAGGWKLIVPDGVKLGRPRTNDGEWYESQGAEPVIELDTCTHIHPSDPTLKSNVS